MKSYCFFILLLFSLFGCGSIVFSQPVNDVCPGILITSVPYSGSGNTSLAADNFTLTCASGGLDVVYSMILPCSTAVTASLCTSSYNTAIAVRTGRHCPGITQIACNDNFCGQQSSVTFNASEGVFYYIIVDGSSEADAGEYTLNITGVNRVPSNDNCPGKIIPQIPFTDRGSTLCATNSYSICAGATKKDVYYRYTANQTIILNASLCGSDYDSYLEIRKNGSCPGNFAVGCNDNASNCSPQSQIMFQADSGSTYYFTIGGSTGTAAGLYNFTLEDTLQHQPQGIETLLISRLTESNDIELDWNSIVYADDFQVYRDTEVPVSLDLVHLIATITDTFFVDSGVVIGPDSKCMYVVTAVNQP